LSSYCKGICDIHDESQFVLGYDNGQKFCKKCQKYFKTESVRCYCCKNVLRSKKKHNKTWKDGIYDSRSETETTKIIMNNCDEWLHEIIAYVKGTNKVCLLRNKPK